MADAALYLLYALAGWLVLALVGAGIFWLIGLASGRDGFAAVTPAEKALSRRVEVKEISVPLWVPSTLLMLQRVLLGILLFQLILVRVVSAKVRRAVGR